MQHEYYGGELEILRLGPTHDENKTVSMASCATTIEERVIRVWTPPGYSKQAGMYLSTHIDKFPKIVSFFFVNFQNIICIIFIKYRSCMCRVCVFQQK